MIGGELIMHPKTVRGTKCLQPSRGMETVRSFPMIGKLRLPSFQSLEMSAVLRRAGRFAAMLTAAALWAVAPDAKATSELGDYVWLDVNTNGLQDAGEVGLAGIGIKLFDSSTNLQATVTSDTNGLYHFTDLPAGVYYIQFIIPTGPDYPYDFTTPNVGTNIFIDSDGHRVGLTPPITLGANETNISWDVGLVLLQPGISLTKLAGSAPAGGIYYANPGGEDVTYTYIVTNTGNTYLTAMSLFDVPLGLLATIDPPDLMAPGESRTFTADSFISESITNLAEMCGLACDFKARIYVGLDPVCADTNAIVLICPPPDLIPPSNQVVECGTDISTNAMGSVTVTNGVCDCLITNLTYSDTITTGSCPQARSIERVFTVQDVCGHSGTATQIITVVDTTPPVLIGVPGNTTNECSAIAPPPVVAATDNCDTNALTPVLVTTTNAGACANSYTMERIWSVGDACGNMVVATQLVTVVDTTPPVLIGVPSNTTNECNAIVAPAVVSATDNCDTNTLTPVLVTTTNAGACPNSYSLIRVWNVSDACGNSAVAATQLVSVVDTTPPVLIGVPSNTTNECSAIIAPAVVSATDNCDTNTLTPVLVTTTNAGACPNSYSLIRVWNVSDACGNSAVAATQVVTVVDTTPPVLIGVPTNINVSCDEIPAPAIVTAVDNCGTASITVVLSQPTVVTSSCAHRYTLQLVWTASDQCGNSIAATQLIFVADSTPPVIGFIPTNRNIDCMTSIPVPDPGSVIAVDNCSVVSNLLVMVTTNDNGRTGLPGDPHIIQYIYTVLDECGNLSAATQTITQSCNPSYLVTKTLISPAIGHIGIGSNLLFKITVTNTGDITIVPQVFDIYDPEILAYTTSTPPESAFSPGLVVWSNLPPIPAAGSASILVNFTDLTNGFSTNTAVAVATTTNGYPLPPQTSSVPFRYVVIGNVYGMNLEGKAVVAWDTEGEEGTSGFTLSRKDAYGRWTQVSSFIAANGRPDAGATYGCQDTGVMPGSVATYMITELETRGRRLVYGPFTVSFPLTGSNVAKLNSDGILATTDSTPNSKPSLTHQASAKTLAVSAPATTIVPATAIKAMISSEGIYQVSSSQLMSGFGKSESDIRNLLAANNLAVFNMGKGVSSICSSNGIMFYGVPTHTIYASQNVYWIALAKTASMVTQQALSSVAQIGQSFWCDRTVESNFVARPDIFDDPNADIWLWQALSVSSATGNTFTTTFDLPGLMTGSSATITLRLKGGVAGVSHDAKVSLNGIVIGDANFADIDAIQDQFVSGSLRASNNTLAITAKGDPMSTFLVDSFTIHYRRAMTAIADTLIFSAEGQSSLTVSGFSRSDIDIFNVTDSMNPVKLAGASVMGSGANFSVSFIPPDKNGRYLASLSSARSSADLIIADVPSYLASPTNRADYIIIASSGLKTAAQTLADYRATRGLNAMVVDIQDVFDEFNYGMRDPNAIRNFVTYTARSWAKAPKYITLAGQGSLDYKNNLGYSDCAVPPLMVQLDAGLQTSDAQFGDINGDGRLEIAVGRLPATGVQDLQNSIAKIKAFELGGASHKKAVALSDNPDSGGNFPDESDKYAVAHMKNLEVSRIYLGSSSAPTSTVARSQLFSALYNGCGYMTYFGHSTRLRLASEQLLSFTDVPSMANGSHPPIMVTMTCVVGDFGTPGVVTLGESLLNSSNGAVAVVGPGSKVGSDSCILSQLLTANIYEKDMARLGDAVNAALNSLRASGLTGLSHAYNFMGDAALELKSLNASGNNMAAGSALVQDFDGDGASDIAVWSPATGGWDVLSSSGQATPTIQFGWSAEMPVAADYDGDGITDYALFYPAAGNWYIVESSTGNVLTKNWGWSRELPVPADYDGDGKADLAVYDPPTGTWYINLSSTNQARVVQWGWSQAIPVAGDYDGDGKADIAVYVPATGSWNILQSSDGKVRVLNWGWSQAMPVPADYDGDKHTDIAVYVPASGSWSILQSHDGSLKQQNWGYYLAAPVPGDYDGDGRADITVYVPSAGAWYILQTSNGTGRTVNWGTNQSMPVLPQFQINRRYFPSP